MPPSREPIWKQHQERCTHFSGLQHEACDVGVIYTEVALPSTDPTNPRLGIMHRLPCFVRDGHMERCAQFHVPTDEEAQAEQARDEAFVADYFKKINGNICPTHNVPITKRQVGRCVYADPCGCRLYQGRA